MWSAPVTVTPAVAEPIDIETAKVFLRIDGDDQNVEVDLYARGARSEIERVSSTRFMTQTVDVSADVFADLDTLPIGPVQLVTSLTYRDQNGATQTLDPSSYELFGAGLDRGIRPATGKSWPAAAALNGAITVRLIVGYQTIPPALMLILFKVLRAEAEGVEISIGGLLVNHRIWLT